MTYDNSRDHFAKIGRIMEDASVIAVLDKQTDELSPTDRLAQLKAATQEISIVLAQIQMQLTGDAYGSDLV